MDYNDKDIIAVRYAIDEDARYTVEEISGITHINSSGVFSILKECLKLRKVCARWVPHLLTDNQKRNRMKSASDLIDLYGDCDQRRLNEIVTGDETWIYFFEPETRQHNKTWIGGDGQRPQIARRNRSVLRVMYALFFDAKGPVAQVAVHEGTSVTGLFCGNVLSRVVEHYKTVRPATGTRGIKLLHDNAPSHKSGLLTDYLQENGIAVLPHPPYSPDLDPCDFWLNSVIKEALRGRKFETRHAVGSAVFQCMKGIPKDAYRLAFHTWIRRLRKCIEVKGEYFEGLV